MEDKVIVRILESFNIIKILRRQIFYLSTWMKKKMRRKFKRQHEKYARKSSFILKAFVRLCFFERKNLNCL